MHVVFREHCSYPSCVQ